MSNNTFYNNVLKDIRVELADEFDNNFERKAFFDRPWAPLSKNYQPTTGSMLLRTGALRRSLKSRISGTSIIFPAAFPMPVSRIMVELSVRISYRPRKCVAGHGQIITTL